MLLSGSTRPHLLIVAPFHNAPNCEAIVTGGNVEFSIHLTCVSSFASAQDASLVLDGSDFDPFNNLAQPVACLDEDTNTLNFLRCKDGIFPSDPVYLGRLGSLGHSRPPLGPMRLSRVSR
jgi:hypothetical protein